MTWAKPYIAHVATAVAITTTIQEVRLMIRVPDGVPVDDHVSAWYAQFSFSSFHTLTPRSGAGHQALLGKGVDLQAAIEGGSLADRPATRRPKTGVCKETGKEGKASLRSLQPADLSDSRRLSELFRQA